MLCCNDLPDEVMIFIFSYLSLFDRKNARLVSLRWRQLCNSTGITKDDIITVKRYCDLDRCKIDGLKYCNIRIKQIVINPRSPLKFWKNFGNDVKSVDIYGIHPNNPLLSEVSENCPNLEFLSLSTKDVNGWGAKNLAIYKLSDERTPLIFPKLLSLDLWFMNTLKKEEFEFLTKNAMKLKRIGLFYKKSSNSSSDIYSSLLDLFKRQGSLLKEVVLENCMFLSDDTLSELLQCIGPQLTGLYIPNIPLRSDQCIDVISNRFPNLSELDLSGHKCFSDNRLAFLLSTLKKLEALAVTKTVVHPEVLGIIGGLNTLKKLDFSGCQIPFEPLQSFLPQQCYKLKDLRLSNISKLTNELFCLSLPGLKNLEFLYLNNCRRINNNSVSAIFLYCKKLRCLSLQYCTKITSLIYSQSINDLKGLIHLDLFGCRLIEKKSIEFLELQELQSLDLSDVFSVTKPVVLSLIESCPSLQRVHFGFDLPLSKELGSSFRDSRKLVKFQYGMCPFEADSIFD